MIEVVYRREVPYSQAVILSQYFDLEHLERVHPQSFGRARMLSSGRGVMADALLLASTRVQPSRLSATGYRFRFPDLESALRHLLGR